MQVNEDKGGKGAYDDKQSIHPDLAEDARKDVEIIVQ
jgi:hypothetical protein